MTSFQLSNIWFTVKPWKHNWSKLELRRFQSLFLCNESTIRVGKGRCIGRQLGPTLIFLAVLLYSWHICIVSLNAINIISDYIVDVENFRIRKAVFREFSTGAPACTNLSVDQIDFTLVTQLSLNRMWMMKFHCERWITEQSKPQISIAVYVGENKTVTTQSLDDKLNKLGCPKNSVTVQILSGYSYEDYPVNALRNLALSAVRTSHVVYVDVDFWVSTDLRQNLLQHRPFLSQNPKAALVLPAFQLHRPSDTKKDGARTPYNNESISEMPNSKESLVDLIIQRKASSFDPTNFGGHGSTRYRDWLAQPADTLLPIQCVNSNRYEPYLVFRYCNDLPPFQEDFTGYGKNKMTWMMQLRFTGYELYQIGKSFVIHYPHLESLARKKWNGGKNGKAISMSAIVSRNIAARSVEADKIDKYKRAQIDKTFIEFRDWLHRHSSLATKVPVCQDFMNDDEKLWVTKNSGFKLFGRT